MIKETDYDIIKKLELWFDIYIYFYSWYFIINQYNIVFDGANST